MNGTLNNLRLQLKNIDLQFNNIEMQMNMMSSVNIKSQIMSIGIQILNIGVQTLIYSKDFMAESLEKINNLENQIQNIAEKLKNIFPNQMMNQGMMSQGMMTQGMMMNQMMGMNMNNPNEMMELNMMNNNQMGMMDNPLNNISNGETGMNNPIFKLINNNQMGMMDNPLNNNSIGEIDMSNPSFKILNNNQMGMIDNPLNNNSIGETGMYNPIFKEMNNTDIRYRFTKTGLDQFKEGVDHVTFLKYLKKLFGDIDDVNRLLLLKQYLNKWNKIAKKLKQREDLLKDAFDTLNLKNLIDATNTVKNASIAKKVDSAVPVARAYDFFDKLRKRNEYITKYTKLGEDLVKAKDDLDGFNRYKLLRKLYKVYYYKVLDNMFNRLNNLNNRYKDYFGNYFLNKLKDILLSKRSDRYNKRAEGEKEPKTKRLLFKGRTDKRIKVPQDRSVLSMLLPSLIKYLNDKFLNHKKWAWDKLADNDRALKFCKLYRIFSDKTILQPKRDLVDLLKAEYAYMNGLGVANCDLFKLLRRYWIKLVCDSMLAPSRIYKILYLIKMVMMHKTIAYQRFIRELVRKWRFSAFIQSISRRKLELMYKNLHVSYLQMANELFGEKGSKNASVVKEFERLATRMGIFTNEDYNSVNEENFCEKITKKYVFQPMPLLLEKEGPTQFFASGIEIEDSGENNEDYYVDQELGGETIGKYKQETNKSSSKADKNSSRLSKY